MSFGKPSNFAELVGGLLDILALVVPVIFAIAFLVIVWKVFDLWVINAGEPTKREEGKQFATRGVIVFVIMISIWGILALLKASIL